MTPRTSRRRARSPRPAALLAVLVAVLAVLLSSCGGGVGDETGGLADEGRTRGQTGTGVAPDDRSAVNGGQLGGEGGGEGGTSPEVQQLTEQQSGVVIGASFSGGGDNDFETVPVGSTRTVRVGVRTTFDLMPFQVSDVAVEGPFFSLADPAGCAGALLSEAQPSCEVAVVYQPGEQGPHEGRLVITGDSTKEVPSDFPEELGTPGLRSGSLRLLGTGG